MKIYFDTSDRQKIIVKLTDGKKPVAQIVKSQSFTSQVLLTAIDDICQKNSININDIKEIEFNQGPGSYTGLKVGASVANTLGWLLKIPVNGKKNIIIEPIYQ